MKRSVVFWIWSWPRRSSSSRDLLLLGERLQPVVGLAPDVADRDRARPRRTCPPSWRAACAAPRSSVGMVSRITLPSLLGVRPRSDFWIAFSIALIWLASHGWITSVRGSGHRHRGHLVDRGHVAVGLDPHAVEQRRVGAAGAHARELPRRARRRRACIRVSRSFMHRLLRHGLPLRRRPRRRRRRSRPARRVTIRRMLPGAREVEDDDRQLVVHAERDRGGVHHLQPAVEHLDVA